MAEDCMTHVCALAIGTAACVGLPGALVYAIVRTAAARRFGATAACVGLPGAIVRTMVARHFGTTAAFSLVCAAYYPLVCADVVRGCALVRRAHAPGNRAVARVGFGHAP